MCEPIYPPTISYMCVRDMCRCAAVLLKKVLKADAIIAVSDIAGTIIDLPSQLLCDPEVASKRSNRVSHPPVPIVNIGTELTQSPIATRLHHHSCAVLHLDPSVQLLGQCRGCCNWERDSLRKTQQREAERFAEPVPLVLPGESQATLVPSNVASMFTPASTLTKVGYAWNTVPFLIKQRVCMRSNDWRCRKCGTQAT
jgi:hypothetical protein